VGTYDVQCEPAEVHVAVLGHAAHELRREVQPCGPSQKRHISNRREMTRQQSQRDESNRREMTRQQSQRDESNRKEMTRQQSQRDESNRKEDDTTAIAER
jgi:hypothetical protein